jgi:hypothetical protein
MALSREEISEINRRNAAKSTGPKTPEGKSRASMNAFKHGMRGQKLELPDEPAGWIEGLAQEWTEHYQPASPGRRALIDRAVMATVHHERSKRYLAATLGAQVHTAEVKYRDQQADVRDHYVGLLEADPGAALKGLQRSAAGCRWLIRAWEGLNDVLAREGWWVPSQLHLAIRLLGRKAEFLNRDEAGYWVYYYNFLAPGIRNDSVRRDLFHPAFLPDTLSWLKDRGFPAAEQCREWLINLVSNQLKDHRALHEHIDARYEAPARAAAVEKASMLTGDDLVRWLRYERMHDTMFHRAHNVLERPEVLPVPTDDASTSDDTSGASDPHGAVSSNGPDTSQSTIDLAGAAGL